MYFRKFIKLCSLLNAMMWVGNVIMLESVLHEKRIDPR